LFPFSGATVVSTITQNIVVGIFEDSARAHRALDDLRLAGFTDTDLGVITSPSGTLPHSPVEAAPLSSEEKAKIEQEAATGALVGAGVGSVGALTLAALMIPGFGPLMVGGFLAMLATGAAAGALAGGLAGGLIGMGLPERHAHQIEQALLAGCSVVHVHTDARQQEAAAILDRNGAQHIDLDMHPAADAMNTAANDGLTAANGDTPMQPAHVDFRPEHLHERDTSTPAGGFTATGGFSGLAGAHDGERHFHLPGSGSHSG
jgi:hypothetical protein